MKYLPLIWSGIWRKPGRVTLIFLQVMVAFTLFGALQGMKTGTEKAIANARADLLFVRPAAFGGAPLPRADMEQLRTMAGVKQVTFADGLLGIYQKPDQKIYVLAIENNPFWLTMAPEVTRIEKQDLDALHRSRTGVLVDPSMARKYGWHVGDRIPLISPTQQSNGSGNWTFDIVGTFRSSGEGTASYIVGNYDYYDEARPQGKGTVRNFYVSITDPRQAATLSEAIDRRFANSASETKSASLRENAQQALQSIGDLNFLIRSVVSAVMVALLFAVSTLLMQTIRERAPELAVLKTLGFSNGAVFALVIVEAALVCIAAAFVGLALALVVFPLAAKSVPGLSMPLSVIGAGALGAFVIALASAGLPALRAARLPIVSELAGR